MPRSANALAKASIAALIAPTAAALALGITAAFLEMKTTAPLDPLKAPTRENRQPARTVKFEFHARIPLFVGHFEHIESDYGAGDVDQGIDATKAVQRLSHDDLGRGGCRQVEFEHERFGADRFDLLANLSQFLSAAGRKDDGPEVASQTKCRGLSDPELAPVTIATEFDMLFSSRF